jgi:hypothetical protein
MTTATKKKVASTRKILTESIKDIEAGRWSCGDLCEVTEGPKPMGCALGLLQLNSGAVEIRINPYGEAWASLSYPSDGEWTPQALEALDLLVDTAQAPPGAAGTLARKREILANAEADPEYYHTSVIGAKEELVYALNDFDVGVNRMTPKRALSWFKRALAKLDA